MAEAASIKARPPFLQPSTSAPASSLATASTSPASPGSPSSDGNALLSKTYVIPPRPKPGRKPVTDTPQTKRKEQNREAQRAFRERRAARVGELEDELAGKQKAWSEREATLERALLEQQQSFRSQLEALQNQQDELQRALDHERRVRMRVEDELQVLKKEAKRYSASSMTSYPSGGSTPWSGRAGSPVAHSKTSQLSSRSDAGRQPSNADAFDPNCRRCENGGTCACLEEKLAGVTTMDTPRDAEPMEIDFTTSTPAKRYSTVQAMSTTRAADYAPHDASPPSEPCGFCTDSQNCVCNTYSEPSNPIKLAPVREPGSCDKCQQDPERARFCQMLAQAPPLAPSASAAAGKPNTQLPSIDERMAMSCDKAYDTLSREPAFRDRRNSLSFINQFRARPAGPARRGTDEMIHLAGQSALEVDIAGVLAAMRAERNEEMRRSR